MGYESKVIFMSVIDVIDTSKTLDEARKRVAKIANAEGVVVPPPGKENERDGEDSK